MTMEIISAREAFNSNKTRYFTGKPCIYGHLSERLISNGSCAECLKNKRKFRRSEQYEYIKVWRLKNPESRTIEARKYREKHPDKVKAKANRYRERNIDKIRERDKLAQRRMRAINPEAEHKRQERHKQKKYQLKVQIAGRPKPSVCEVCGELHRYIVFDHCHKNGKFRGWLCDRCNKVLGIVQDSAILLKKLALYLEEHSNEQNNNES